MIQNSRWTSGRIDTMFDIMSLYPYTLHCQRLDPDQNMARFYVISIQPALFGQTALVRYWGRVGTAGARKIEVFLTEKEAAVRFLALAKQKRRRGYRPI